MFLHNNKNISLLNNKGRSIKCTPIDIREYVNDAVSRNNIFNKCYILIKTTNNRILKEDFDSYIISLSEQTIIPDKIFITTNEPIPTDISTQINMKYPLVDFNYSLDTLDDSDLIIFVDDQTLYSRNLVESFLLCYELYLCDSIILKYESDTDIFYTDNVTLDNIHIYAFIVKSLRRNNIKLISKNLLYNFPDICNYDNLVYKIYMYIAKLYVVENRFIVSNNIISDAKITEENILVDKICKFYNIKNNCEYHISKKIIKRDFYLVDGLTLSHFNEDIHASFIYLDPHTIMLTISVFNDTLIGTYTKILFDMCHFQYSLIINIKATKFSHILHIDNIVIPKPYQIKNTLSIIQTSSSQILTKKRYYSILSILNNAPEYLYYYFDDNDIYKYVYNNYSEIVYDSIQNLIPGAYISDFFRYCYLLLEGGVYLDCKKILYIPLSDYINNFITKTKITDIFVKDLPYNYAYNAVIICEKNSRVIKFALIYSIYYIINNLYGNDPLCITGPGCLGVAVDYVYDKKYPYYYFNTLPFNLYQLTYITGPTSDNKHPVIKNTYNGYYNENSYGIIGHYDKLWHLNSVYKNDLSKKYSIDKMSDIVLFKVSSVPTGP